MLENWREALFKRADVFFWTAWYFLVLLDFHGLMMWSVEYEEAWCVNMGIFFIFLKCSVWNFPSWGMKNSWRVLETFFKFLEAKYLKKTKVLFLNFGANRSKNWLPSFLFFASSESVAKNSKFFFPGLKF